MTFGIRPALWLEAETGLEPPSAAATAATAATIPKNVTAGDIIQFGDYDWRVLDVQDDRLLIVTEKVTEQRAYNNLSGGITWADCSLREYLNGGFYGSFSDEDKARILETNVKNKNNPERGTAGGNDTTDYIFLLSIDEVFQYFGNDAERKAGTSYWLRSPGQFTYCAAYVSTSGSVSVLGVTATLTDGIRPALWLSLDT
jgi:hypothetical protein